MHMRKQTEASVVSLLRRKQRKQAWVCVCPDGHASVRACICVCPYLCMVRCWTPIAATSVTCRLEAMRTRKAPTSIAVVAYTTGVAATSVGVRLFAGAGRGGGGIGTNSRSLESSHRTGLFLRSGMKRVVSPLALRVILLLGVIEM